MKIEGNKENKKSELMLMRCATTSV